ncbi:MAG: hypothetical protein ABIJ09_20195 [Pseudomonadota bacterium]
MLPFTPEASTPSTSDIPEVAPRHLIRSIRKLNALYDELNALVEQARAGDDSVTR